MKEIFIYFNENNIYIIVTPIRSFGFIQYFVVNRRSLNLLILVYILFKIILYIRCYRKDPDPAAQKSTDPTFVFGNIEN